MGQSGSHPDHPAAAADLEDPHRPPSPAASAASNNFGFGSFWGGVGGEDAGRVPLVDRPHPAHLPQPTSFPTIPPGVTLSSLQADGLRQDLAFVPFQMSRNELTSADSSDGVSGPPSRPTIRATLPFQLKTNSIRCMRNDIGDGGGPMSSSSSSKTQFRIEFQFSTLLSTRVHVQFFVHEIRSENHEDHSPIRFATRSSGVTSEVAPNIPSQTFPPGSHTWTMAPGTTLDIRRLTDQHLTHSFHQRYYPMVIQFEEVEQEPAVAAAAAEARIQPRVSQCFHYATFVKSSSSSSSSSSGPTLSVKIVRSGVYVKPRGEIFIINEIYGFHGEDGRPNESEPEEEKSDAGAGDTSRPTIASPPQPAVGASASAAECVICLSAPRDTMIVPCRHMCLCWTCAQVLHNQSQSGPGPRCPVCRGTATVYQQILKTPPAADNNVHINENR